MRVKGYGRTLGSRVELTARVPRECRTGAVIELIQEGGGWWWQLCRYRNGNRQVIGRSVRVYPRLSNVTQAATSLRDMLAGEVEIVPPAGHKYAHDRRTSS